MTIVVLTDFVNQMPLSVSSLLLISALSVLFIHDIPIVPESLKHSYVACADSCRLEEDDKKPAAMLGRSGNGRPASATITVPGQGSGAATGDFAAAASAASARDTLSPKAEGASQVRARCSPEVCTSPQAHALCSHSKRIPFFSSDLPQ